MRIVSLPSTTSHYHLQVEGISDLVTRYVSAYRQSPEAAAELSVGASPRYIVPTIFDDDTAQLYCKAMDQIASTYAHARDGLEKVKPESDAVPFDPHELAQLLLPVACETTLELQLTPRDLPVLFAELTASRLSEAAALQVMITEQVDAVALQSQQAPAAEQQDSADTASNLPAHSIDHTDPVRLLMTTMRNEFDLLPYILYERTGLSFDELVHEIKAWPIERKLETYETYLRQHQSTPEARALHPLDHLRYNWDIVTDYASFTRLQTRLPSTSLLWQPLTPRYGFGLPTAVEDAGLVELFETCYELSFTLHSALTERGHEYEAQYSLLRGHKLRCLAAHTAREAATLLTDRELDPLLQQLHARLSEVHPIFAASIK
jgi:hypothetical protein